MAGGYGAATPAQQPAPVQQPAPGYQPTQGPNIFDQSASAYTSALNTARGAAGAAGDFDEALGMSRDAARYAGMISGGVTADTVRAQQIASGQLSNTNLAPYMNPYTQNVINVSASDLERARQQAMIQAGGAATAANAFGGSRHGVAMAETNRAFDDNMARMMAGLNQANFAQAQQAGQFDISSALTAAAANQDASLRAGLGNQTARINAAQVSMQAQAARAGAMNNAAAINAQARAARAGALTSAGALQGNLSNLGFGMGMQANNAMMQQGALQQAQQQQLIDQSAGQYGGWAASPINSTQGVNQALGSVPSGGGQTTQQNPGLFNYLALAATACWVAREVYGPENPAWLEFREWLMSDAPAWFRKAYLKHGPKWAEWVNRNPWSKRILRPLMDAARKSRKGVAYV